MRKDKIMFMALIFLVSLLCISAVSAADDVASDVIADTDTNDATVLEDVIDDASISDSQSEENVLTEDLVQSKTFTELKDTLDSAENEIELESDYKYDEQDNLVDGITISHDLTINGKGHTIDGNGKARIFHVPVNTVVIFKNITFINSFTTYDGYGGAIWSDNANTVKALNCNFINNSAGNGGAVARVDCENCNFLKNNAYQDGGAIWNGKAKNCIFLSNSAIYQDSKDMYNTANESCIIADSATLSVSDFITVPYSGEKQMITLTGDGGDTLNNVPVTVKVTKDGEEIGTYSGLSGDGWTVDLGPGKYIATFSVDGNVEDATSNIRVTSGTSFEDLDYLINKKYSDNTTIYLDADYAYEGDSVFGGIGISRDLTIDGNGHTINGSDLARTFSVTNNAVVTFYNITFVNGFAPKNNFGGAIWECDGSTAKAVHCVFRENTASYYGGAVAGVDCEYCDFFFNKAENYEYARGGAIYNATAVNCTFMGNEAIGEGGAIYIGSAIDSEFIGNKASSGGAIIYGNATNCIFESNNAGSGGAIRNGNATDCTFSENSASYGGAISYGNAINSTFTRNEAGNGGAIDMGNAVDSKFFKNSARQFGGAINDGNALNCNFTENTVTGNGMGGAISKGNAVNSTFTNNVAYYGGAISDGNVINSTFTDNSADHDGGAIYRGNAINCNFTNNHADHNGGAIYNGNATDSTFALNSANMEGGAICGDRESDQYVSAVNCTFNTNVANANGGAIAYCDATNCSFTGSNVTNGHGTAMYGRESHPCQAVNCIFTDNNPDKQVIEYGVADSCTFNGDTPGSDVVIANPIIRNFNFISTYNDGSVLVVNITSASGMPIANVNIKTDVYTTTGTFVGTYNFTSDGWKVPLNGGYYKVTYNATDFDNVTAEGIIVVNKEKSAVSSKAVTTVYNNNKYLVITLKDSKGKAISGAKVTVTLASAKAYKTDKNGQIKINIGKLIPKTYTAKISFAGNTNYLSSSTTAKVVVKKATPKMTAKAKTFKVKVKTKKFKITLKNNLKKVMKNTKVTLRVNKKTFTAKTNSKGVATFKITNLKKKGKFTAVIKYAGSKYYNKVTKKVKITVKK